MSATAPTSVSASFSSPALPSPSPPQPSTSTSSTSHHATLSPVQASSSTSPSTLPHSPETLRQIAEARTALEASMTNIGNSLSVNLQSRAQNLHANSTQLEKQQKEVVKATEGLRKENEKLVKLVGEGQRKVKELGNVQNWAEMLERDFLVLSETLRLVRRGSDGSGSYSGSSYTGSYSGSEDGERDAESIAGDERRGKPHGLEGQNIAMDGEGNTAMEDTNDNFALPHTVDEQSAIGKGKGRAIELDEPMQDQPQLQVEQTNILQETQQANGSDQVSETVGGSSTAGTGSGTDPSSSSVHTLTSVAS